ncbi:hypothetical protein XENOCAPTIV_000934 [Xenoophorus captivus]|uniref:Cadherin domain-containing protein n=1 Tax=Xenoophorus captivus TaxID=1517983 RepID=A0ABV0S4D6_9TELE
MAQPHLKPCPTCLINGNMFLSQVLGPFLIAELTCYEDDIKQIHSSKQTSVRKPAPPVFWYLQEDACFFRIDLPNSGKVVLNKPLDYESRTRLQIIMWAQESNTEEKFNISTVLTVNIEDVDDQYPHFLPCTPVSPDVPVCMNPTYSANITQKYQDSVLEFSPGPIRAKDGDRGINAPLLYTILSGQQQSKDLKTGEIRLTRAVDDRQPAVNFTLTVMVCQVEDRLKYSLTTVLVRVLSVNSFPPLFNTTTFKGFIIQSSSPASIVSTYGNQGVNPNIRFFLHPPSRLFQVTQEGVLIARTDKLQAFDRHILQVEAELENQLEPNVKTKSFSV